MGTPGRARREDTRLRGIVPPLATPLFSSTEIDIAGLERLTEHVLSGGVDGVFVLGTTGEGPSLDDDACHAVIQRVCRHVGGRVPVLAAITDPAIGRVRKRAEFAHSAGAWGLVLAPPYYFGVSQDEIAGYLERLLPELPLPVYLYNIPGCTKVNLSPDVLRRAACLPNFAGLKDSSGDMSYFAAARAALPAEKGYSVFCGPEELLAESMKLNGDGGVCGGANLFPKLYVRLYQASLATDESAHELHELVMEISHRVYALAGGGSSYLRGLKAALSCLGICDATLAEPFQALSGTEVEKIREAIRDVGCRIEKLG